MTPVATMSRLRVVTPPFLARNVQGLVGSGAASNIGAFLGQRAIMPQFQGQVIFEKDLYGKAAFANRPRGFVFDLSAGFQRTQYLNGVLNNAVHLWAGQLRGPRQQLWSRRTPRP